MISLFLLSALAAEPPMPAPPADDLRAAPVEVRLRKATRKQAVGAGLLAAGSTFITMGSTASLLSVRAGGNEGSGVMAVIGISFTALSVPFLIAGGTTHRNGTQARRALVNATPQVSPTGAGLRLTW